VSELRIDYGPGYRVYFTKRGAAVVILLAGGDKRTQAADIRTAIRLAQNNFELDAAGRRRHYCRGRSKTDIDITADQSLNQSRAGLD
jgi:hypothetical protein